MATRKDTPPRALICGEVRTCLLPSFLPLDRLSAAHLLKLRADESVLASERPSMYTRSPDTLTGVDCRLPAAGGAKARAIGTVAARAALTEGRILQSTAYFSTPATGPVARQPWGHYLVRPGVLEPFGKLPERAVAQGLLAAGGRREDLDLGSIAENLLTGLQRHPLLDHKVPFKSRRTQLRWVAQRAPARESASIVGFTLAEDGDRFLELRVPDLVEPSAVAGLCEDLALHDWLLTTVVRMLDGSRLGSASGQAAVAALRPAVDHLIHLWMPGARVDRRLAGIWDVLETEPGFSRQWQNLVLRIRDQLALQALSLRQEALPTR